MTVKRKGLAHLKELSHGFRVAPEVAITILERASNVCVPNNAHIIYVYTPHIPAITCTIAAFLDYILTSF